MSEETNKTVQYVAPGVIQGLYYQKLGQHRSRRKAQALVLAVLGLVFVPFAIYNQSDGGRAPDAVYRIAPPVFGRFVSMPPSGSVPPQGVASSSDFLLTGYVGPVRIVAENRVPGSYPGSTSGVAARLNLGFGSSLFSGLGIWR